MLQNKSLAFELYQRSAELGSRSALENVAAMYATGDGVQANERSAQYILKLLKEQGGSST